MAQLTGAARTALIEEMKKKLPTGSLIHFIWHHATHNKEQQIVRRYFTVLIPMGEGRLRRVNKQLADLGLGTYSEETDTQPDLFATALGYEEVAEELGVLLYDSPQAFWATTF